MKILSNKYFTNGVHAAISICFSSLLATRLIKHFPSSNYNGLMAPSLIGSGLIIISALPGESESLMARNTRISVSLFSGSCLTYILASRLKEKVCLGFHDAKKLTVASIFANLAYGVPVAFIYPFQQRGTPTDPSTKKADPKVVPPSKNIPPSKPGAQSPAWHTQGERPFYEGRTGFQNLSARNCMYNSMAIIVCHTITNEKIQEYLQIDTIQKEKEHRSKICTLIKDIRTKKGGQNRSEQEAKDICTALEDFLSLDLYGHRGGNEFFKDGGIDTTSLKKRLFNSDWRVIRVGGGGHWYTYVRNKDSDFVDEINDTKIKKNVRTIQNIFDHWSKRSNWNHYQITFY